MAPFVETSTWRADANVSVVWRNVDCQHHILATGLCLRYKQGGTGAKKKCWCIVSKGNPQKAQPFTSWGWDEAKVLMQHYARKELLFTGSVWKAACNFWDFGWVRPGSGRKKERKRQAWEIRQEGQSFSDFFFSILCQCFCLSGHARRLQ